MVRNNIRKPRSIILGSRKPRRLRSSSEEYFVMVKIYPALFTPHDPNLPSGTSHLQGHISIGNHIIGKLPPPVHYYLYHSHNLISQ